MSNLTEQVREGLENKRQGIEIALRYVKDPREIERLQRELKGATEAIAKLDEADTRSTEEVEKIVEMVNKSAEVITDGGTWSEKTPSEKFQYHVKLYLDKLHDTEKQIKVQHANLTQVVQHLKKTKGDSALFMNPIIKQFETSLAELVYSGHKVQTQLALEDEVDVIIHDEDFFNKLDALCRFLNNPMSLPHLDEEEKAKLEAFRDALK